MGIGYSTSYLQTYKEFLVFSSHLQEIEIIKSRIIKFQDIKFVCVRVTHFVL